jgi:uncharacterized protein YutE (UPF0331/DUF86 family)
MPEFRYAAGRIAESVKFLSEEIREFDAEYASKSWKDYQKDKKIQKLMDRTVENILTALIELCGTVLAEEGIGVDSYSEALRKSAEMFGFSIDNHENLAGLAIQRNRLAHRYLDFRWQAIKMFGEQKDLVVKLVTRILERERKNKI